MIDQEERVPRTCMAAIILQIVNSEMKSFSIYHFSKSTILSHFLVSLGHFLESVKSSFPFFF
jgi:hypothetical protein